LFSFQLETERIRRVAHLGRFCNGRQSDDQSQTDRQSCPAAVSSFTSRLQIDRSAFVALHLQFRFESAQAGGRHLVRSTIFVSCKWLVRCDCVLILLIRRQSAVRHLTRHIVVGRSLPALVVDRPLRRVHLRGLWSRPLPSRYRSTLQPFWRSFRNHLF
jgi:hypothetical protein